MSNRRKGVWGYDDRYPNKSKTKKTWEKYDNDREVSGGCILIPILVILDIILVGMYYILYTYA